MANVKGVILNGAKYESQDTEARTLVGQAINQVETLENTVTDLETGFTNIAETVANVNQTATIAKTTADEANTLAQQAETKAQAAYELVESAVKNVYVLPITPVVSKGDSRVLTEEQTLALLQIEAWGERVGQSVYIYMFAEDSDKTVRYNRMTATITGTGLTDVRNSGTVITGKVNNSLIAVTNNGTGKLGIAMFSIT